MAHPRHRAGLIGPAIVLLLSCCCPAGWLRGAAEVVRGGQKVTLKNGEVATTFDLETGAWQAADGAGAVFAKDLKCSVDADGKASTADTGTDEAPVTRQVKRMTGRDAYGQGVRLVIEQDGPRAIALIFTMYDAGPFFLVQLALPKSRGVKVNEITLPEGNLLVGGDVNDVCTLVNYWNGNWYSEIHPVDVTDRTPRWETHSHYYLAAHNRGDGHSVVLGSLYPRMHCDISAAVDSRKDPQAISFAARLRYDKVPLTIDEDNWQTQPVFVCAPAAPKNVFDGLETYAAVVKANRKMRPVPPPTGWCSWDAGASADQKAFFANVDAMKANRLDEYGLKYVQLDDGWQQGNRCSGTWRPRADRFPAGMKGVADYVKAKGFEPGLWIGPFGEDGRQGGKPFYANDKDGGYDLSSEAFQTYLRDEMHLYVNDWGFRYIKADFLTYGGTASPTVPYEVSHRQCVKIMEDAVKAQGGYLLTCVNDEWLTPGLSDGQRLGDDVAGGSLLGLYPTLKSWPRRYFTNGTFWVGDPDSLHVNLPTDEQARTWASFVALTGGATMSGDDLTKVPKERIDILKKALPAQGITARPVDLFDQPAGWSPKFPRVWDCKVDKPGVGTWHVVGLFNWTVDGGKDGVKYRGAGQDVAVDLSRGLGFGGKACLVYDFWAGKYLGQWGGEYRTTLKPGECRVLVVREAADVPQVLGTDRHIVCGAEDLRAVRWDEATATLSGVSQTVKDIPYSLTVHRPSGWGVGSAMVNGKPADVKEVDHCLTLDTNTGPAGRVEWAIAFKRLGEQVPEHYTAVVGTPATWNGPVGLADEVLPRWSEQAHDVEAGPIVSADGHDLSTVAPFRTCWDLGPFQKSHPRLVAECAAGKEGKVFFEAIGDGKRLWASDVLEKEATAKLDVSVEGVKELTLACHRVDGWFSSTRGTIRNPRLVGKE